MTGNQLESWTVAVTFPRRNLTPYSFAAELC